MQLDVTFEDPISFPRALDHVGTPPIKCQGIKTKLIEFILSNIKWDGRGKWIEPFLGSGVVLFNSAPKRAIASDTNKHIIEFYKSLQTHKITPRMVRDYLEVQGKLLEKGDGSYYYEVRKRFNSKGDNLDFVFLSRACFNGVMRFNSKGEFNVPYNHNPARFTKAYITKIVNQVDYVASLIEGRDWTFVASDYKNIMKKCDSIDFVYLDPPYPQRHNDYYNQWTLDDEWELSYKIKGLAGGWALSLWKENEFRKNESIERDWKGYPIREFLHAYHVGSFEDFRHKMKEALIIRPGSETQLIKRRHKTLVFGTSILFEPFLYALFRRQCNLRVALSIFSRTRGRRTPTELRS